MVARRARAVFSSNIYVIPDPPYEGITSDMVILKHRFTSMSMRTII